MSSASGTYRMICYSTANHMNVWWEGNTYVRPQHRIVLRCICANHFQELPSESEQAWAATLVSRLRWHIVHWVEFSSEHIGPNRICHSFETGIKVKLNGHWPSDDLYIGLKSRSRNHIFPTNWIVDAMMTVVMSIEKQQKNGTSFARNSMCFNENLLSKTQIANDVYVCFAWELATGVWVVCALRPASGHKCAAVIVHRTEQPNREIFSAQNIQDKTNYGNKYRKESIRRSCNVSKCVCVCASVSLQLRLHCDEKYTQHSSSLGNYTSWKTHHNVHIALTRTPSIAEYYTFSRRRFVRIRQDKMWASAPCASAQGM